MFIASVMIFFWKMVTAPRLYFERYAVIFFCYYWMRSLLTERHLLRWDGRLYRITSIAGNVRRNELQIATEQVNE